MRCLENGFYPIIAFEQGSCVLIAFVVSFGITIENSLDQQTRGDVSILANKEMIMVRHEAISDQRLVEIS